jgi:hypothetical protein
MPLNAMPVFINAQCKNFNREKAIILSG